MSVPTKYKFKDYEKALRKIATDKGFLLSKENKSGSARRFEVFEFDNDDKPKLRGFGFAMSISTFIDGTCKNA